MNKARVNWSRGSYSDVFRTAIIEPSPLKEGQQVRVIWGKRKKEYSAIIETYPLAAEQTPITEEPSLWSRQGRAKRKLIPDATENPDKVKRVKKGKEPGTEKPKEKTKSKEKPKGKILAEESPSKISASEDSTDDSDFDDNIPLSSFTPTGPPKQMACIPVFEQHGHSYSPPDDDMNPESGADHTFQGLLAKAINTIENVTTECQNDDEKQDNTASELQLMRTILERLECAFAKQEAKIEKLLQLVSAQSLLQTRQPARPPPQPQQLSTPDIARQSSVEYPYTPLNSAIVAGTPQIPHVERILEDVYQPDTKLSDMDSVPVGGSQGVRLEKADYSFAKAAVKPSQLALRLVDKLFSKEVLMRSTVHGTKEFSPLDQKIVAAIKAEIMTTFGYQCRNSEELDRMWETCKISIGKRCQNLRNKSKQN